MRTSAELKCWRLPRLQGPDWSSSFLLPTFCPRNKLLVDRIVNPSPGPSSMADVATESLSLSVPFDGGGERFVRSWNFDFSLRKNFTLTFPHTVLVKTMWTLFYFMSQKNLRGVTDTVPLACGLACLWPSWRLWRASCFLSALLACQGRTPGCPSSLGCLSSWRAALGGCEAGPPHWIWLLLSEADRHRNACDWLSAAQLLWCVKSHADHLLI